MIMFLIQIELEMLAIDRRYDKTQLYDRMTVLYQIWCDKADKEFRKLTLVTFLFYIIVFNVFYL